MLVESQQRASTLRLFLGGSAHLPLMCIRTYPFIICPPVMKASSELISPLRGLGRNLTRSTFIRDTSSSPVVSPVHPGCGHSRYPLTHSALSDAMGDGPWLSLMPSCQSHTLDV